MVSRRTACLLLPFLLPVVSSAAVANKPAAKRRAPARDPLRVTPSESLENRVREEIAKAEAVLKDITTENLFASPHLVSAVYYSDGFLAAYPTERADGDPSRRIIGHVVRLLTPELKSRYIEAVRRYSLRHEPPCADARLVAPADYEPLRRSRRRQLHKYAIDLFAREGSPVRSSSDGLVILAEGGWDKDDPLSTSSREGGNTVIVYDAGGSRFFRYCHLDRVLARAGDPVRAGDEIGTVGHTGRNASRKGHGRHLHFEINVIENGAVRPLSVAELREFLREAETEATVFPKGGTRTGALP